LIVKIPFGTGSNLKLNYQPSSFTLLVGVNSTVTFVNDDTTKHTVTATDNSFNSGDIQPGGTWTHTFTTLGAFDFHCIYHTWMKGTILVTGHA